MNLHLNTFQSSSDLEKKKKTENLWNKQYVRLQGHNFSQGHFLCHDFLWLILVQNC